MKRKRKGYGRSNHLPSSQKTTTGISEGEISLIVFFILFLIWHVFAGIQYVRLGNAQWVTMQVDEVYVTTGRHSSCIVHLSYQGHTFTESLSKNKYGAMKDLKNVEVLHIPDTGYIQFESDGPARQWMTATWWTLGFIVYALLFYRDAIGKLNRRIIRK